MKYVNKSQQWNYFPFVFVCARPSSRGLRDHRCAVFICDPCSAIWVVTTLRCFGCVTTLHYCWVCDQFVLYFDVGSTWLQDDDPTRNLTMPTVSALGKIQWVMFMILPVGHFGSMLVCSRFWRPRGTPEL